tara:strand:+ start:952 stop:3963 length:3012 start_codon:yes stop_codon:yes gene_type:complete
MSFKLITNDNIVRNNITLEPSITYVSASVLCEDIVSHEIVSAGVYGEVSLKNTLVKYNDYDQNADPIKGTRVYDVDLKELSNIENPTEILTTARNTPSFESFLKSRGIYFDNKSSYKFGVDKIKQKYLIDDENYYKKKAVKNLYTYYSENIENRQLDCNWGISNYSTLNFFSTDEKLNANISNSKTHQNVISYPNLLNSQNIPAYDFNSNNLTFSFYINQRRKNKKSFHFNPGCIFSIPKLVNIFIVKGSQTDINGLTDAYRIYIELGSKTLLNTHTNMSNIDLSNSSSQSSNNIVLSSDDILKYNNWQNVSVVMSKNSENVSSSYLTLYIDGILVDNFVVDLSFIGNSLNSENSFICVGNKFENLSNNIVNYTEHLFSNNKTAPDDTLGPYVNKNISFGKHGVNFITGVNSFQSSLNENLSSENNDYTDSNTSNALNAEIHDLRIYNVNYENFIKEKICDKNITNFNDESLIFSLPIYYYDVPVMKKGLVNLYNFNNQNIDLSNLYIEGPINYYFSNKCLGHELMVENFVYEFKQKICPNISFGGVLKEELLKNSISLLSLGEDLTDSTSSLCSNIASGKSLLENYFEKIKNLDNSVDASHFETLRLHNFYYRNNLILPNDNGLQEQNYEISGYYENYSGEIHKLNGENNYQFVRLDKLHTEKSTYSSDIDYLTAFGNNSLIEFSSVSNVLKDINERETFFISLSKTFKTSYDHLNNISLNNFHSGIDLTLESDASFQNNLVYKRKYRFGNFITEKLSIGRLEYLKDFSNPASRKINSNYNNSIANFLPVIASKNIDNSEIDPDNIGYFAHELPMFNITGDNSESYSNILCISSNIFRNKVIRESVNISDSSLAGTGGNVKISLSDNGNGLLYRNDCLTKIAVWNYVGHLLYKEGIATILHPGLENFSQTNYKLTFKINTGLNVLEMNLPARAGETNVSRNKSYVDNLKIDNSAFNADEDFVYISDINLHDENLNIIANVKLANPFPKKNTDNVLFRIKMDF